MAATAQPLEADRFSLLGRKRSACGGGSGSSSRRDAAKFLTSPALQSCKREWVELPPPRPSPSPCAPPRRAPAPAAAPQTQGAIRVVHIFAPKVIKTDVDNFRAVVQRLTGHRCEKPASSRLLNGPGAAAGRSSSSPVPVTVHAPAAKRPKLEMAHATDDGTPYAGSNSGFRTSSSPSQSQQGDKSSSCATVTAAAAAGVSSADDSSASAAATDPDQYRFPAFQGNHIACRPGPGSLQESEILDMDAPVAHCLEQLGAGCFLCCATYPPSSFQAHDGHHSHHHGQQQQQQQLEHQDSLASSANSNSGSMHVCDSGGHGQGGAPPLLLPTNLFSSCAVAASSQQQQEQHQYYSSGSSSSSSSSSFLPMGGGFHPALALGASSGLGLQGLLMGTADLNWVQEAAINMIADAVHIRSSGMHMGLPPFPGFAELELSDTDFLADLWGSLQPSGAAAAMPLPHDQLAMHPGGPMDSYEFAVASQLCRAAQP